MEKEKDIVKNILTYDLPCEILTIIKSYIPCSSLIFLNTDYYSKYHYLAKKIISKYQFENYIRDMVRKDIDFCFLQILKENYKKWMNIKNYIYKNIMYKNYLYFLTDFCIYNESVHCRNVLNDFLKEHGLCQNRHKKNTFIHIRWKT